MILWLAAAARAETVVLTSLEWAVDRADAVVLAQPAGEDRLLITEFLSYPPASGGDAARGLAPVEIAAEGIGGLPAGEPALLALDLLAGRGGGGTPETWRVTWVFGQGQPMLRGAEVGADGRLLETAEAIEAAVRARLASGERSADVQPLPLDLEGGEAWRRAYAGSAVYLLVPPDERYLPLALEWARSESAYDAQRGAAALASYPGAGREELLALLAFPPSEVSGPGGAVVGHLYGVRDAAIRSLALRGEYPDQNFRSVECVHEPFPGW